MIRRRDGSWLPFWREDDGWVVTVRYVRPDGRGSIGVTRTARTRLGALWAALRGDIR
jgi:hypothetical protein